MKDELQGKLVEILTNIQGAVGKASDFAMDQIPDIAMQYLRFSLTWEIIETILAALFTIGLIKVCKWAFKKSHEEYDDGFYAFTTIASGALSIFTFFATMCGIKTITMISIAPKVWLIKELAGMIK